MNKRWVIAQVCALWLVLLTGLVYLTGGTRLSYTHLLYLPVTMAAVSFGTAGGAVAGVTAGLLMAFMPVDTATGQAQTWLPATTRLFAYVTVGSFCGWLVKRVRHEEREVRRLLEETVEALANTVESNHRGTSGHSIRVAQISVQLGKKLRLGPRDMYVLRTGALLHDIGKLAIPVSILDKQGPLSAEEYAVMMTHTIEGDRIMSAFHHPRADAIRDIIRHHHERLDGSGYPDRLSGDDVSLLARIVGIADVYDAMCSDRPYRPALNPDDVIRTLETDAAKGLFDPAIVAHLKTLVHSGRVPHAEQMSRATA